MLSLTSPVKTPYHNWSGALKLIILSMFTMWIFLIDQGWLVAASFIAVVIINLFAGIRFTITACRHLFVLGYFIVIVILWHALAGKLLGGVIVCTKLVSAMAIANLVTMTTQLTEFMTVIERICIVFNFTKKQSRMISTAFVMVIRFTPILAHKGRLLSEAWKSRSCSKANWRILAPLVAIALDDAEHVAEAFKSRGGLGI